eukprot:c16399_g1_i1 orf=148-2649(+)
MAAPFQGLSGHPAQHVNSRNAAASGTLQARLHNFVKYALLQQLVPPGSTVCDLYCGHGVDTEKWAHAQIGRYVGVDFAASTLEEAWEQWNNHNRPYSADFCEIDPSSVNLETELRHMGLPADFVTCMGQLQDCFLKEEKVRSLLKNVASILKPGGYFFGITADSSTIWSKFQKAVEGAHRAGVVRALPRVHSEHYIISFEDDRFTPFGTKYTLNFIDGAISESQQLIHFPSFIRLAEEVGLEYIELQNLQEFYDDYRLQFPDILRATCANLVDPKGRLPQSAHDILSLYTTFIFKKADPDYMLSPFPPLDEDQLEMLSEDACDGNRAPLQEHLSPPNELNLALKKLPVTFVHQNEVREALVSRPEEDQRAYPSIFHVEANLHQSPLGDACKESVQDLIINGHSKQSDNQGKEGVKLEVKAASENVMANGDNKIQASGRSLGSEDVTMEPSGIPRQDLPEKDCQHPVESMEKEQAQSESPREPIASPLRDDKQHPCVADEATVSQLHIVTGDELMREASVSVDVVMEEITEEQKEQSCSENQAFEENLSKQFNAGASLLRERTSEPRDVSPPKDDLPTLVSKDTNLTELEIKEQKMSDQRPEELKIEISMDDSEVLTSADAQKASSPADFDTDGDRTSLKQSGGRINTALREETASKRLMSVSSLTSGQQRYRGRSHHHHHLPYSDERQEHSHGLRHNTHSSHSSKVSRDRVGDHRSEHLSPNQRGDSQRGRSRNVHHSPTTFVPFNHFVPQTEFPVFQSPNTPGILGPGPPPVLLIEPMCPLWPIPPPLERRVFPKTRTPRKLGSERESFGGRGRRESPKRHWKDSPPPGTES